MKRVRIEIIALLLLLLTGCTKEDVSMCTDPSVGVTFSYTHNADRVDKFASEVTAISLFAFDERQVCVATFRESGEALRAPGYTLKLQGLTPGRYTLVAWADASEASTYLLSEEQADGSLTAFDTQQTLLGRARTVIDRQNDRIENILTDLYHGMAVEVEVGREEKTVHIPLIKNTNLIRASVRGLEKISGTSVAEEISRRYTTSLTAANGRLAFDNTIPPTAKQLTYLPRNAQFVDHDLRNETKILRMQKEVPVWLSITDRQTGEEIVRLDIVKLLLQIPGNGIENNDDLDRYDTYDVIVDVSNVEVELTVILNGWTIKIVNGGMG